MEQLHVAGSAGIQPVFDRDVVDKGLRLAAVAGIFAGRDASAQHDTDAVVPETFGETEIIIGTLAA